MAKLDLRIRDQKTGETVNAMFESEQDACEWLADRPKYSEVLGVATHGLPRELYVMLRAAARPLDAEEEELHRQIEAEAQAAAQREAIEEDRREREEIAAHREAMRHADPNRPMQIEWTRAGGFKIADPADPREVTQAARDAVTAWVRERDEWVKDRGQIVGEAIVTVWPDVIPDGEGPERILPGAQFFPTSA